MIAKIFFLILIKMKFRKLENTSNGCTIICKEVKLINFLLAYSSQTKVAKRDYIKQNKMVQQININYTKKRQANI
jgi:hypothetical protein